MNTTEEKPASVSAAPKKRGDIISSGVFEGEHGKSVCWVDFVTDPLLFAISKGLKGWSTVRNEPRHWSDKQKESQLRLLQNYVFSKIVCELSVKGDS